MKQPQKISTLVNWFYGNYCTRKCYGDEQTQQEHYPKLRELAQKLEGTTMTHRQFLNLIRNDKTICNLSDDECKKRKFSWKNTNCALCRKLGI